MLALSGLLAMQHGVSVRTMQETGLPAAVALPAIEQRIVVIKEQAELAQFQASVSGGTEEEMLNVFVLPKEADIDRLLATFDVLFTHLKQKKQLVSFSAVEVGAAETIADDLSVLPITFSAELTDEGLSRLLLFIRTSGLLTIHDALRPEDTQRLLTLTEEENPAAITALEQFLSTDLLRYAKEPQGVDAQLLKSFSSETFTEDFHAILHASGISEVQQLLKELDPALRSNHLWPLRFLSVEHIETEGNAVRVRVKAYVR